MKILLMNLPNVAVIDGQMWSGTNAGSCWPYTVKGFNNLAPFPFFLAWAASCLQAHGHEVRLYDGTASQHYNYGPAWAQVVEFQPDMVVLELNSHMIDRGLLFASRIKAERPWTKVVFTGPHMAAADETLLNNAAVDHFVQGEYDLACLKLAEGDARRLISHEYVKDIDTINGKPWFPYRDQAMMAAYCDPSMVHTPIQLQVNTSRGCNYACTYCSWPATMYRRRHARKAEIVLAEIDEALRIAPSPGIQSIFFDDEMWNAGDPHRLKVLCDGLHERRIPWSFMGRIDTSTREQIEHFVACGCVGMRFGVESFHQHLLDRVNKRLNVAKSWEMCRWILSHFSGLQVRLLTMKGLPGETHDEEASDNAKFLELQALGAAHRNRVDLQSAVCIALPGTELWKQQHGQISTVEAHPEHRDHLVNLTVEGK